MFSTEMCREGNRFARASNSPLATMKLIGGTVIVYPLTLLLKISSYSYIVVFVVDILGIPHK